MDVQEPMSMHSRSAGSTAAAASTSAIVKPSQQAAVGITIARLTIQRLPWLQARQPAPFLEARLFLKGQATGCFVKGAGATRQVISS